MVAANKDSRRNVKLGETTSAKWDAIRRAKRWSLTATADALADDFMERHGIHLENTEKNAKSVARNDRP